ncbi:MAG: ArnT family glycosyltransferase [Candidatus Sumerlaeaceae bacterium]
MASAEREPEGLGFGDSASDSGAGTSPWLRGVDQSVFKIDAPVPTADRVTTVTQARLPLTFFQRRITIVDLLIALLLAIVSFGSVALTYKGFGHSWDEALYLKPSQAAYEWWRGVFVDRALLQPETIERHWGQRLDSEDPLHPEIAPLPKLILGAGAEYLGDVFGNPMLGMRLPIAVLFGATVGLAFLFAMLEFGRLAGCAAALFYWLTPRVFGHAHIGATETLLAFCIGLTSFVFILSTRRGWLGPLVGLVFGLAIATKVNALLLPLPLLLWGQIYRRREYASAMFWMLVLGPLIALALWPWLWHDGLRRFFGFLLFYVEHQATAVYYLGRTWGYTHGPAAPWHYPWIITAVGVPEWLLLFGAIGILRSITGIAARPASVLILILALFWICVASVPGAPKYDGERLFFPSFFFLALLAAGGYSWLFGDAARRTASAETPRRAGRALPWILLLAIAGWGAGDLFFSHPNQLNYFNWLVGRPSGAYKRGFETSYWGEALNEECTAYLQQKLKPGERVQVLAMNELCFENLREWGRLPANDFRAGEAPIHWIVLQVRQGFFGRYEHALHSAGEPVKTLGAQGVPKIEIFRGPANMDARRASDNATSPSQWRVEVIAPNSSDGLTSNASTTTVSK